MKRFVFAGLAAAAATLVAGAPFAQEAAKTTWDGVYTDAQAERGAAGYTQHCAVCHGAQLAGTGEAKPLAGPEFLSSWDGLSLGELLERTRTTMPLQQPGSLSREDYTDILAYVLKFNAFPAGPTELSPRTEVLNGIRIVAFKPQAALSAATPQADAAEGGPNDAPNPYVADAGFFKPPPGRTMGSSSAVAVDSKGHVWVADRCGANNCTGSPLDPIMEFDANGNFIKAFGAGRFNFPHGFFIDAKDRIWITDNQVRAGKGAQVFAFDANGKQVMALGKAGVQGEGADAFFEPNAVVVAKDGTIFVADGHSNGKGAHRIVKFDASGQFLKQWGTRGPGPGQLEVPHTIALDSKGRLFVGDRWNNRVVVYDQDGKVLSTWTQFGRPSGVFVDRNDVLYVADSESRTPDGYGHHPGWKRGIRVGSARDGQVTAFIPDTEANPDAQATSGPEGLTVDRNGVIYGAEVFQKRVVRYAKK